jgi:hypothetical protein
MAIKHTLALDIPDTACENILRIMDASIYAQDLVIDCPRLDITLPGFTTPIYVHDNLTAGFVRNLSLVDLKLQSEVNDAPAALPDGLYKIRYSVSPADKVFVEYYHLRTTQLSNTYHRALCKVQLEGCEPSAEQHQKLHDLRYIKMYIDAAKAQAEYCHAPKQAIEMMVYAERLIANYLAGGCITCNNK